MSTHSIKATRGVFHGRRFGVDSADTVATADNGLTNIGPGDDPALKMDNERSY